MSDKSREHRIAKIRGGSWIRYTRAEQILTKLEDLLAAPKSHRMPNLLIVGETNNGKTMIVERFAKRHRPEVHFIGEPSRVPVVIVQAPPVPDEARFYNAILTHLYKPFRSTGRVEQKQREVLSVLSAVGVRMLIIDEIHHVLAGTTLKQRQFRNVLKYLGNELQIPLVAVGTRDAFHAISSDPQLANRFEPAVLLRWQLDEEYLRLLASFESLLPLEKPSRLAEGTLPAKILSMTEGTIGELAAIIASAAIFAIRNGKERIDASALDACGYISPSDRRRQVL